jgi:two-component system, NarL family, captular synthesis response regulator RcsB
MEVLFALFRNDGGECELGQANASPRCATSKRLMRIYIQQTREKMEHFRVVLADDHLFVLLGIRSALSEHSDITVAGEATGPAALIDLLQRVPCEVLVTDMSMPGTTGALEDSLTLIRHIRHDWPALRVVVLTGLTHSAMLRSVIAEGVLGIVSKTEPMSELVAAIRSASAGRTHISRSIRQIIENINNKTNDKLQIQRLSQRESEVVRLFAQGQSISEIAITLGRDVRLVNRQKRFAMVKLGVTNDPGLFAYVRSHGKSDN